MFYAGRQRDESEVRYCACHGELAPSLNYEPTPPPLPTPSSPASTPPRQPNPQPFPLSPPLPSQPRLLHSPKHPHPPPNPRPRRRRPHPTHHHQNQPPPRILHPLPGRTPPSRRRSHHQGQQAGHLGQSLCRRPRAGDVARRKGVGGVVEGCAASGADTGGGIGGGDGGCLRLGCWCGWRRGLEWGKGMRVAPFSAVFLSFFFLIRFVPLFPLSLSSLFVWLFSREFSPSLLI